MELEADWEARTLLCRAVGVSVLATCWRCAAAQSELNSQFPNKTFEEALTVLRGFRLVSCYIVYAGTAVRGTHFL